MRHPYATRFARRVNPRSRQYRVLPSTIDASTELQRRGAVGLRFRPACRHHRVAAAALALIQTALECRPHAHERLDHSARLDEGGGGGKGQAGVTQSGAGLLLDESLHDRPEFHRSRVRRAKGQARCQRPKALRVEQPQSLAEGSEVLAARPGALCLGCALTKTGLRADDALREIDAVSLRVTDGHCGGGEAGPWVWASRSISPWRSPRQSCLA